MPLKIPRNEPIPLDGGLELVGGEIQPSQEELTREWLRFNRRQHFKPGAIHELSDGTRYQVSETGAWVRLKKEVR